jgi:hypothetical protein
LSSLRISELIENPRPSTHKRRLFSRFALGMIGMHDSTDITASFRPTNTPLNALSNSCATPALNVPDRGLVYASDSLNLACTRDFDYRTCMEQELPLMTGEALQKKTEVRITRGMSASRQEIKHWRDARYGEQSANPEALLPVCPSSSDQDPNCECRSRV